MVFTTNGVSYAVNGVAKGTKKYEAIEEVWAENPSIPGTKKNIGPNNRAWLKVVPIGSSAMPRVKDRSDACQISKFDPFKLSRHLKLA